MNSTSTRSDALQERMRLIRFRRAHESLKFSEEVRLVPKAVWITLGVLYLIAQAVVFFLNWSGLASDGQPIIAEFGREGSALALAGIVTAAAIPFSLSIALVAYVNRDAKRRGMNWLMWTWLVIVMMPAYVGIGFLIYFLSREPLPYPCPKCLAVVNARFNFCPACRTNLHPSCAQCKREVGDTDCYCPHCAADLQSTSA
jgi:hypothetical protein